MATSVPPLTQGAQLTVMPNTGAPVRSATEMASEAALQRLAATGSVLPAAGTPGAPAPAPTAPPAPLPTSGQAPPAPIEGVPAITPPAPGDAAPAGTEDPNAVPAITDDPAPATEDELTVLLPGREGDEEFAFKVETAEAADRLRQLKNGYVRGTALRVAQAEVAQRLEEVEGVRQMVDYDPAGFVMDNVLPENPAAVDHLILYTLTQPEVFNRLAPTLQKLLTDETEFRTVAAEQKAERFQQRETVQTRIHEARAVSANLADIQSTVGAILPSTMSPEAQQLAYADCMRDLKAHADRYNLLTLPVHEIPTLLARRLTALGINPVEAAQRAADAAVRNAGAVGPSGKFPAPRAGTPNGSPAANGGTPAPRPGGKTFVTSMERRKEAGSIPPTGAGSPSNAPPAFTARKPDGSVMTTEEALAAHRARLAKGIRSY